jgi:CPA1 family monovalent cation:H+ antiporter
MTSLESLSVLLSIAALSAWINHRYLKLSSAIGLMSVSLLFSLLLIGLGKLGYLNIDLVESLVRSFDFEQLLMHGMLAFLLFAGALTIRLSDLSAQRTAVALLSTFGVMLSTAISGTLYWLGLGWLGIPIPFIVALLFGAIISPTDAVAVLGILRKVGVPKTLETKVVGESLFNDGVGVVVFLAISTLAFGQAVTVADVGEALATEVVGGAILGLGLGYIAFRMLKTVDEYVVELLLTLSLASGGYALGERLHVSAPICAVVSGLIIGNQGRALAMTERTREHLDTFWELIDELLNAILFVLIGLEILTLTLKTHYVGAGLLAIVAALTSRVISVWLPLTALSKRQTFRPHTVKILAWGGLKGGISVALALSLPLFEFRDLIIVSTYIVVLFSVLIQGSTLPLLLRRLKSEMAE